MIVQLVDKLQGTKMFTKMDLRWGYDNIHIKEGDEWKAAFMCHHSAFEPLVMFFGLCNSPSTFQTMMNKIFADMEDVVVVYIDNIMIFTKTDDPKKHSEIMLEVLCHLEENNLYIKSEKCTMGKANGLSRHEGHMIGIEDDNKGVLVIPLEHVRQNQVLICDEGNKIYKKIKKRL